MSILEDLTILPPHKLEKRLDQLAKDALPCIDAWVADGNPEQGLTIALHIDARTRRDVQDLGRVIEAEPTCLLTAAWALLAPGHDRGTFRLLLRVELERPVQCSFVIRFDVTRHPHDPVRAALPLLLAASRFIVVADDRADVARPAIWFAAPPVRECLLQLIAARSGP